MCAAFHQEMLLAEWPNEGAYDFLYLPRNSGGKVNFGYAFVNFTSESNAAAFQARWHRARLSSFPDVARCLSVSLAEVQGFAANVRQLKMKPAARMRSRHCKPFILVNGQQVPPPPPLRCVRSPTEGMRPWLGCALNCWAVCAWHSTALYRVGHCRRALRLRRRLFTLRQPSILSRAPDLR